MELFTKDAKLPPELRRLRYDVNSVTHFGDREYSKNGHRTIIFKDHNLRQNRKGLSDLDLRKIETIYGSECQKRDRQEKIDLCQNYPGVARRKRQIDLTLMGPSLRMNRDITAPPDHNLTNNILSIVSHLGIENEAREILDKANQLTVLITKNAKGKYCNTSDTSGKTISHAADVLGMIDLLTNYAKSVEVQALANSTGFCSAHHSVKQYRVARCGYNSHHSYGKPTRVGDVRYSTQYRPTYRYSTKQIYGKGGVYDKVIHRAGNETDSEAKKVRRKRSAGQGVKLDDIMKSENYSKTEEITDDGLYATVPEKALVYVTTPKLREIEDKELQGRRHFKDFSVHKRTPNKKAWSDESDLSLELKNKEERTKRVTKKKNHSALKKKVTSFW